MFLFLFLLLLLFCFVFVCLFLYVFVLCCFVGVVFFFSSFSGDGIVNLIPRIIRKKISKSKYRNIQAMVLQKHSLEVK